MTKEYALISALMATFAISTATFAIDFGTSQLCNAIPEEARPTYDLCKKEESAK